MSVAWQVLANQPTPRPRWNTGVTTVKSNRCPEAAHGSLVIRVSPGLRDASGWRGTT